MINDNIQIWFAKNNNGNIVTIDEVDKTKEEKYYCPICGSELIARQGDIMSWHFAHVDKSKCNNESIYHFWYKNKLLQPGDKFIIRSDSDKEYICKEILVEESYKVGDKLYKPDLTAICESGETIYFEFDYTNKKKLQDYIDLWIELGNIVVEIDVKTLLDYKKDKLPIFKTLWYDGKCFNVKKGDTYYNTIGKYKERLIENKKYENKKSEIEKLDWLWKDIVKYKKKEVNIEHMVDLIDSLENEDDKDIVEEILNKPRCNDLYNDYIKYKSNNMLTHLKNKLHRLETDEYEINLSNLYKKYTNNTLTQDICFHDIEDNSVCYYNIFDYSSNMILQHINNNVLKIKERKQYNLNLKYALNNICIKNAIEEIDIKYKNIDDRYHIYHRFSYGLYVSFYYNRNELVDFDISKREDIIYSNNEGYIKNEIEKELDLFFNGFNLFENIYDIENILNDLNKRFNTIGIKEHRKITFKTYTNRVEEEFIYGIEYESKSQGLIEFKVLKYDKNSDRRYGKDLYRRNNLNFYIFNNSIYWDLNKSRYELFGKQHKEHKKYLILIARFNNYSDLKSKLISIISDEIRRDRYKIEED